jgi:hypothetical protein
MGNINISTANTKAYAKKQRTMNNGHYSKQTQTNPIPARREPPAIRRQGPLRGDTQYAIRNARYAIRNTRYEPCTIPAGQP